MSFLCYLTSEDIPMSPTEKLIAIRNLLIHPQLDPTPRATLMRIVHITASKEDHEDYHTPVFLTGVDGAPRGYVKAYPLPKKQFGTPTPAPVETLPLLHESYGRVHTPRQEQYGRRPMTTAQADNIIAKHYNLQQAPEGAGNELASGENYHISLKNAGFIDGEMADGMKIAPLPNVQGG